MQTLSGKIPRQGTPQFQKPIEHVAGFASRSQRFALSKSGAQLQRVRAKAEIRGVDCQLVGSTS